MNKIFIALALALVFTLGSTAHAVNNEVPVKAGVSSKEGDTPKCVKITKREALSFAVVMHSFAFAIGQDGGTKDVESKLTDGEGALVGIAFTDLHKFALTDELKCWSMTQAETIALLKAEDAMTLYIQSKPGLLQKSLKILINNVGDKAHIAMQETATVTKTLIKHAGVPDDSL